MRLIDADKLHPDRMANGTLAISQSQIANAKTVEAVPFSVIEDIKAEINTEYKSFRNKSDKWDERASGIGMALEIIDRKIAEVTKNEKV